MAVSRSERSRPLKSQRSSGPARSRSRSRRGSCCNAPVGHRRPVAQTAADPAPPRPPGTKRENTYRQPSINRQPAVNGRGAPIGRASTPYIGAPRVVDGLTGVCRNPHFIGISLWWFAEVPGRCLTAGVFHPRWGEKPTFYRHKLSISCEKCPRIPLVGVRNPRFTGISCQLVVRNAYECWFSFL
jgi:hypothetical protein